MDGLEITSLLKRERYYRDTCQWEKLRSCYHPDVSKTHIEVSVFIGNADAFITFSQKSSPPSMKIIHQIDPVDITVRGAKALAQSIVTIAVRFEHEGSEYDFNTWMRVFSKLEKCDGRWNMLSLEAIYNRDSVTPASPLGKVLQLEGIGGFRRSYKHFVWFMSLRGIPIQDDLPGEDDPESVRKVVNRNIEWIETT